MTVTALTSDVGGEGLIFQKGERHALANHSHTAILVSQLAILHQATQKHRRVSTSQTRHEAQRGSAGSHKNTARKSSWQGSGAELPLRLRV